jgi:hypothetical protein
MSQRVVEGEGRRGEMRHDLEGGRYLGIPLSADSHRDLSASPVHYPACLGLDQSEWELVDL